MIKSSSSKFRGGFTGWELLIVLITVSLAVLVLPAFFSARVHSGPRCISNVRQIGLAFRLWSGDHQEKFPMAVSTNDGGSLEFLGSNEVFQHFLVISNEVNSPNVLVCREDKSRKRATNFATLSNRNLSYFVGLDADETRPQTILSGDRNISTNGRLLAGTLTLTTNYVVNWTKDLHARAGNIGLADGSAQTVTNSVLLKQINTNLPTRLAIP